MFFFVLKLKLNRIRIYYVPFYISVPFPIPAPLPVPIPDPITDPGFLVFQTPHKHSR